MAKTPLEILKEARELISDRRHWCKDALAKKREGRLMISVNYDDPEAQQFCAVGAVRRVAGMYSPERMAAQGYLQDAAAKLFQRKKEWWRYPDPTQVNDRQGHKAVMQMYDKAIELAEKKDEDNDATQI